MKQNKYIVELELRCGEIEKTTTKLVSAINEAEAGKDALLSEIHYSVGDGAEWEEDDDGEPLYDRMWDANNEWVYTVYKVTLVEEGDFDVLKKYLH
jgi:hypothetical protein